MICNQLQSTTYNNCNKNCYFLCNTRITHFYLRRHNCKITMSPGAEPQQGLGGPWPPQNFKKLFYIMYKY